MKHKCFKIDSEKKKKLPMGKYFLVAALTSVIIVIVARLSADIIPTTFLFHLGIMILEGT